MSVPVLSVIVPTYNRLALLEKTLDALAEIQMPGEGMEVIVVDDGSTDGTLAALGKRHDPFALRVFKNEGARGPAAARNHGARQARGAILGFLDSDVVVQAGWWQAAAPHFSDPGVTGVEGATETTPGSRRAGIFDHLVLNCKGGNYLTCNMLYRREAFERLGGFDTRYPFAHREDSDFAFTVLDQGGRIVFEPGMRVWHPVMRGRVNQFLRETRYGLHEALLRRKHPALYRQKLKWIDGREFPAFYWGVFLGWPALLGGWALQAPLIFAAGVLASGLGWAGAVYGKCRKRDVRLLDLLLLVPQFLVIPWLRLYWVLRGEWKFRQVRAISASFK